MFQPYCPKHNPVWTHEEVSKDGKIRYIYYRCYRCGRTYSFRMRHGPSA